jgi:hypothetical protein
VSGLFFDARTSGPRQPNMFGGATLQLVAQFVPAPANRFRMQTGNLRHLLQATMSATHRFARRNPAALLFIQPAEKHIELPMILPIPMIPSTARRTPALKNHTFHDHPPSLEWLED